MSFLLPHFTPPDFSLPRFSQAPDAVLVPSPKDKVAPEQYHATTIFPEYFKIGGQWLLAKKSRMDCVAVYENGDISIREFRRLKRGDLVVVGRTEDASEGIFVYPDGFSAEEDGPAETFSFRQGRSRETAYSRDYDSLYDLLRHEKEHGYITWVLGPACAFDHDSRAAFSKLVQNGYVNALLAGNALATHDLEAAYRKTALGQDIYTQKSQPNGHYNHIDTINRVRLDGSICPGESSSREVNECCNNRCRNAPKKESPAAVVSTDWVGIASRWQQSPRSKTEHPLEPMLIKTSGIRNSSCSARAPSSGF